VVPRILVTQHYCCTMEKEVELLERVLLRFAMAEEGEQLEKAVSTFLVLTIDKLASPHEATRNKVRPSDPDP
jgi:hypothetical protein